jgi:hypothetical protein
MNRNLDRIELPGDLVEKTEHFSRTVAPMVIT